jgi:hypothetical protein
MIIKHFNFNLQHDAITEFQSQLLWNYLKTFYVDKSSTVLINTAWIPTKFVTLTTEEINEEVARYTVDAYNIFAGASWPPLEHILTPDNSISVSELISAEITNFLQTVNEYRISLSNETHIKKYILTNQDKINNVIVYSLVDPADLRVNFLNNKKYRVIRINSNSDNWIDFGALVTDKFVQIDTSPNIDSSKIVVPYMIVSELPQPHCRELVELLRSSGTNKGGYIMLGGRLNVCRKNIDYLSSIASLNYQNNIKNSIDAMSLGDIDNWNRHFLNIVTEKIWDVEKENWWSEKIFKPIIGHRPFLVYAPNGCVNKLTSHGFQHYCNDFTDISNLDLTEPNNIPAFLKQLSDQPTSYLKMKYDQLYDKILFNNNRYTEYVKEQWATVNRGLL